MEALLEAQQVHEALRWQGALCDVVNGDRTDAATLRRYQWRVLPGNPALPAWRSDLSFVRSPAPLTREDWNAVAKAYQHGQPITPIRDTGLAARVLAAATPEARLFEPTSGGRVAAAAWSRPGRIALHLLNYRVPIGRGNEDRVASVGPLQLSLPLPGGGKVRAVRAWSPERDHAQPLPFQERAGRLLFTLPSLHVYEICEIERAE